jgi:hypothetical protein
MIKDEKWKREGLCFCGVILANLLFHSGMSNWDGGWSLGPRYLTPSIPFLMTAAVFFISKTAKTNSFISLLFAIAAILSVFMITLGTIVFPFPDAGVQWPIFSLYVPLALSGAFGMNLGELLGLSAIASAIIFYTVLLIVFLLVTIRPQEFNVPQISLARTAAAVVGAVIVITAGMIAAPPADSFVHYARGSIYYFLAGYRQSANELQKALLAGPEPHLETLIKRRLNHLARQAQR